MRLRIRESGALIAVLACLLSAGAWQQIHARHTQVIHYTPPVILVNSGREGYCWTQSIAAPYRPDAWRCMEGNAIHDPCFGLADKEAVICGVDPTNRNPGFQLTLTKPLPASDRRAIPPQEPWAWMVQLSDGATCTPFTGTRPFLAGEIGYYGCRSKHGQETLLLGELDNRKPLWKARKATLIQSGSEWKIQSAESVPVTRVWQ